MDGLYYTAMILGAICISFFAAQLLLCFKTKRTAIKLIPAYLILLCALPAALLYAGVLGTGFLNAEQIVAALLAMGMGAATVGNAIAWAVYGMIKLESVDRP